MPITPGLTECPLSGYQEQQLKRLKWWEYDSAAHGLIILHQAGGSRVPDRVAPISGHYAIACVIEAQIDCIARANIQWLRTQLIALEFCSGSIDIVLHVS